MRQLTLLLCAMAVVIASAVVVPGARSAQTGWVIRDLGTLGGPWSRAVAINEHGQVVGWAETNTVDKWGDPVRHAFVWQDGRMRDLGDLGGGRSEATAVNDHGDVVGESATAVKYRSFGDQYAEVHAFLWRDGRMRDLGKLGGHHSEAIGVNNQGAVIGRSDPKRLDSDDRAFIWESGRMRDLVPGDGRTSVTAINDLGQIIGFVDSDEKGFLWRNGKRTKLDFRPTALNGRGQIVGGGDVKWTSGRKEILAPPTGSRRSSGNVGLTALAINDSGLAVGYCPSGTHASHPCIWRRTQGQDIGLPPGADSGRALGVNNRGQVIGSARIASRGYVSHAFVWEDGIITDLGALPGGSESYPVAINDRGEIVGWSTSRGSERAVLWTRRS